MAVDIAPGEKYALIAMSRIGIAPDLPDALQCAPDLWASQLRPFKLSDQWRETIGTLRADELSSANLFLLSKAVSANPGVLDADNLVLSARVNRFFQGLALAWPPRFAPEAVRLCGANVSGEIGVRQFSALAYWHPTLGRPIVPITSAALTLATRLGAVMGSLPTGRYKRLSRALNAFFEGLAHLDLRERLHQFCRCIEGAIYPEQGRTTSQFRSRTELFVGPRHHDVMGLIYESRSAAEHLNDPLALVTSTSERNRRTRFAQLVMLSEDVARYCLTRVVSTPTLLTAFETDDTLRVFWEKPADVRQKMWGPPFDVEASLRAFDSAGLRDEVLGL
jgi:hypothetical protein